LFKKVDKDLKKVQTGELLRMQTTTEVYLAENLIMAESKKKIENIANMIATTGGQFSNEVFLSLQILPEIEKEMRLRSKHPMRETQKTILSDSTKPTKIQLNALQELVSIQELLERAGREQDLSYLDLAEQQVRKYRLPGHEESIYSQALKILFTQAKKEIKKSYASLELDSEKEDRRITEMISTDYDNTIIKKLENFYNARKLAKNTPKTIENAEKNLAE
jgi:hypothetical protein